MDTVTEAVWRLLGAASGMGVIHRNLTVEQQAAKSTK